MTNAERLRAMIAFRETGESEAPHEMLIGSQVLRQLVSGKAFLLSRERVLSIIDELEANEPTSESVPLDPSVTKKVQEILRERGFD